LSEIGKVTYKDVLPRFEGNKYANITDRNDRDFWHPSLVEQLDNSDLLIRPFKDYRGYWTVRILRPVDSAESPNWTGIICNLDIKACTDFIKTLEIIQKEIDEAEQQRVAAAN